MSANEAFATAIAALRANLLRSALTMLGIVIGVAAVIAMVAVGSGARKVVMDQIRSIGSNIIILQPGSVTTGGVRLGAGTRATLTEGDAMAIAREVAAVHSASPRMWRGLHAVAGNANWWTNILATWPEYLDAREWVIASGRAFSADEVRTAAKVALIGATVARNLFGEANPVDQQIRLGTVPVIVIGLLAPKGQNSLGHDQDDMIIMPLTTAKRRVMGITPGSASSVHDIFVKVLDGEDMGAAEAAIRDVLRARHRIQPGQEDDFRVRLLSDIVATRDQTSRSLAFLLAAVATVSLVVGGIGIMNIMLVSVVERTREIGLRLAVGARPRDILIQFLTEATALAALGGAVGVLLGVIVSDILARAADWPTLIEPAAIVTAVLFSALIGVFFGLYPARRAAMLDPIDALRHP